MFPWKFITTSNLFLASCAVAALAMSSPASADIMYATGNQQYYNVNIAADVNVFSVTGDIGNTGDQMTFNTMLAPQSYPLPLGGEPSVEMHCQHGVAFCESYADSLVSTSSHTGFSSITLSAIGGTAWTAGDFALDLLGSVDGNVTFQAYMNGTAVNCTPANCNTFLIDATGQNPYNFFTFNNETIDQLVITAECTSTTACFNLADIKQVSLQPLGAPPAPVPEPASLAIVGAGLLGLGLFRLRHRKPTAQ